MRNTKLETIEFRKAKEEDREQLFELFQECFGDLAKNNGALTWISGRYVVAEVQGNKPKIVAVSGILDLEYSDYNGYEITWTCTTKKYRKKGLIVEILNRREKELPNDGLPLYCDCWKIRDNKYINLHSVMKRLGMNEVLRERIKRKYPYNKDCLGCPNKKPNCYCCGDLYRKERGII